MVICRMKFIEGYQLTDLIYTNSDTEVSIYEAVKNDTGEKVVIKVISRMAESSLQLFSKEAVIAQKFGHPSICRVFSKSIHQDGHSFCLAIIMQRCDSDLNLEMKKRKRDSHPWSESEIWNMLEQVAGALNCAQERGVCHRDIKPQNLLINKDGRVLVSDFGSAKVGIIAGAEGAHTLQGTLNYLSPELKQFYRDCMFTGLSFIQLLTLQYPVELCAAQNLSTVTNRKIEDLPCSDELKIVIGAMMEPQKEFRLDFQQLCGVISTIQQRESRQAAYVSPIPTNYYHAPVAAHSVPVLELPQVRPSISTSNCIVCKTQLNAEYFEFKCKHKLCYSKHCHQVTMQCSTEDLSDIAEIICPRCAFIEPEDLDNEGICLECREHKESIVRFSCKHNVCSTCIRKWSLEFIEASMNCSLCSRPLSHGEISQIMTFIH